MGVIIRQSIKSTAAMYLGGVFGILNRLYLMPKFLSLEQIGMLDLLFIAGLLFANLASLGTIGTLVKYYHEYKSRNMLKRFLGYLNTVALAGIIIVSLFLFIFEQNLIDYYSKDSNLVKTYFPFFYVFLVGFYLKGIFANYSLSNQRATVPSFLFEFVFKILQAVLLLFVGVQLLEFSGLIIGVSIGFYFLIFTLIYYCKKNFGLGLRIKQDGFNKKDMKKVNKFSFFMLFATLSGTITQFIDTAMVGSFQGLAMAGVYSIAFNLGQSIEMPKRALSSISLPIIVKHLDNKEYNAVSKLYKQSSINQGIIGALFLLLIFVSIDSIFYLLPQSKNLEIGKNITLIIGFARFIDMITGVNNEILRASNKYRYDMYIIGIFIFVSVGLNYVLIPIYGLEGAAMASLLAILGFNTIRIYLLQKFFGFFPFTKESLCLILILSALVITRFLLPSNPWPSQLGAIFYIGILSAIYGLVFIVLTYSMKLSKEWNSLIVNSLSIIKNK